MSGESATIFSAGVEPSALLGWLRIGGLLLISAAALAAIRQGLSWPVGGVLTALAGAGHWHLTRPPVGIFRLLADGTCHLPGDDRPWRLEATRISRSVVVLRCRLTGSAWGRRRQLPLAVDALGRARHRDLRRILLALRESGD